MEFYNGALSCCPCHHRGGYEARAVHSRVVAAGLQFVDLTNLTSIVQLVRLVYMTKIVKLYEAKTNLSDIVERAAAGEEFIIAKGDVPKARLVPLASKRGKRAPGGWEGRVWTSDDFDAPLPAEIAGAFTGDG